MTTPTDDELLAEAKTVVAGRSDGETAKYRDDQLDGWFVFAVKIARGYIALHERHRAEVAAERFHAGEQADAIEKLRAEVERLTRERDEAREDTARVRRLAAEDSTAEQQKRVAAESALAAEQKRCGELEKIEDLADQAMTALDTLVSESGGVYGLHLNGDNAPWSELMGDGRFQEWLGVFDELRAALAGKDAQTLTNDQKSCQPAGDSRSVGE